MSYPDENFNPPQAQRPIDVVVRKLPEAIPTRATKTVCTTYILDPAGVTAQSATPSCVQICGYEPTRVRLTVKPWEASIAVVVGGKPQVSPDTSTNSKPPEGAYIAANDGANPWEFYGADVLWLNSLGTITRVTVVKEYL